MSHYHMEILIPPRESRADVLQAVESLMSPFDEGREDDEDGYGRHAFWDWYVIGGRWCRNHTLTHYDPERLDAFWTAFNDHKFMGAAFSTPPLIPRLDRQDIANALWGKHFPEHDGPCPFFSDDRSQQYRKEGAPEDIMRWGDVGPHLTCLTLMIAWEPPYPREDSPPKTELRVRELFHSSMWNGVTWQDTTFDGKVRPMIEKHNAEVEKRAEKPGGRDDDWWEKFGKIQIVTEDWHCVTVDYHS